MNVKYQKLAHCITATIRSEKLTFQGAGKTKEEALQCMWMLYNKYYYL